MNDPKIWLFIKLFFNLPFNTSIPLDCDDKIRATPMWELFIKIEIKNLSRRDLIPAIYRWKLSALFRILLLLCALPWFIASQSQGLGNCLQDEPDAIADYEYPELPPGAMYNADYQCRLQFGGEAQVCSPPDEICSRLWCNVNDTCTTQLRPAAPGTRCGKHMVSTKLLISQNR